MSEERGVLEYEALRRLSQQPRLLRRFADGRTSKDVGERLGLTPDVALRVKEIITGVQFQESLNSDNQVAGEHKDTVERESDEARQFLDSSFAQLRNAYRTLMSMSVVTFVIGVGFLIIAAAQSVSNSRDPREVAVIGGIGVIQLVALFLRNPLRDIAQATAQAQQSRIAIMGYMLAVGLIGESVYGRAAVAPDVERLDNLTGTAIARLQATVGGHGAPPNDVAVVNSGEGTETTRT